MTLQHIDIETLNISPLNMRKYGAEDAADFVTSIQALGLLQPLSVRLSGDQFEVVAGQRRLNALRQIAEVAGAESVEPVPCLMMAERDDAAAVEASLAKNIERLPMEEIDQGQSFWKADQRRPER